MTIIHKIEWADSAPNLSSIFIGTKLAHELAQHVALQRYSRIAVVADAGVPQEYLREISSELNTAAPIVIASAEDQKELSGLENLWNKFLAYALDRNSLVVIIGGGALIDLAGLACSLYMRGIDYISFPSTLLAQSDSCVGSKLAINFSGSKNLIGNFATPKAVFIDVDLLKALAHDDYKFGFAEIIKHALIKDRAFFETLDELNIFNTSASELADLLKRSLQIKISIVEMDFHEVGPRKLLNFGHSIGHALEATAHLSHAQAVILGMLVESKISLSKGLLAERDFERIAELLNRFKPSLSSLLPDPRLLLARMRHDKKVIAGKLNWTLLNSIGSALYNQSVSDDLVIEALEHTFKLAANAEPQYRLTA